MILDKETSNSIVIILILTIYLLLLNKEGAALY